MDHAHAMVAESAMGQSGMDLGLVAHQIEGGDFLIAFQCPPGPLDHDSAPVVATHDIQSYPHKDEGETPKMLSWKG